MQAPFKSAISTNDRAHQMAIRPSRAHRASVLANAVRPRHQACEEATSSASVQGLAAAAAAVAASLTLTIAVPADVLAASSQAEMRAPGVQTITYGLDVAGYVLQSLGLRCFGPFKYRKGQCQNSIASVGSTLCYVNQLWRT